MGACLSVWQWLVKFARVNRWKHSKRIAIRVIRHISLLAALSCDDPSIPRQVAATESVLAESPIMWNRECASWPPHLRLDHSV